MDLTQRLPDDIIRELFDKLAHLDPPGGKMHSRRLGWIILTHVCRRWRIIGISISNLWARVVCHFSPDAKAILQRARNSPLTLNLTTGGALYWNEESVNALLPRTRSILETASLFDQGLCWRKILDDRTLSVLEDIDINPTGYCHPLLPWKGELEAPRLHTCSISIHFPLIAPSLRSLSISGDHWDVERIVDVLECSPLMKMYLITGTRL